MCCEPGLFLIGTDGTLFFSAVQNMPFARRAGSRKVESLPSTPHFMARNQAKDNLVTVRGGLPQGDVCGGQHYHSYGGREEAANKAIIAWIKDHRVEAFVGE